MALSKQVLDDLEITIERINAVFDGNTTNVEILGKISSDDDSLRLLNILNQVKKSNITKILKCINDEYNTPNIAVELSVGDNYLFSEGEVLNIFSNLCEEEITKKYDLSELEQMYISVLGCKPLSKNKSKRKIINSIANYIYRIERAGAFNS